ncbi:hypothetical protein E4631_06365 [Hymenobacter sp. UV11]|uniref:hypothetical protein n=1 Tax=Hymenobacter sp. UV11 TaxID=1849735 RepID=UPI00105D9DBF|nr:hypothetical protein [Hymenobacter sp. UV11]TFZ67599.1 hypothetical protein E4631_06365 [Hymenobacter sp. UV11]
MLQDRQYFTLDGEQATRIEGYRYAVTESGRIWKFWNKEPGKEHEPLVYSKNGKDGSRKPHWIEPDIPQHGYINITLNGAIKLRSDLKPWHRGGQKFLKKVEQLPIHILVAKHFIPNPNEYKFVEHVDRIITNNHYINLRWVDKDLMNYALFIQKNKGSFLDSE